MKISEYTNGNTPRIMVTVRVSDRFFTGTLMSRDGDQATVLVDTPQGGVTAMTGDEVAPTNSHDETEPDVPMFVEVELPAVWAPYIFYGDGSGLTDTDIGLADREVGSLTDAGLMIVDMSDEVGWGSYNGLGCEVAVYVAGPAPDWFSA